MKKRIGIGLGYVFLVLLFILSLYYVPLIAKTQVSNQPMIQPMIQPVQMPSEIQVVVAQDYTDTLKNVYAPPVRYRETEFRQLGYLTAPNRERLPLFGRVLNRRDKWVYYTLEQGIKLPIEVNRRICTQSPGCDSLSSGDEVHIEGMPYKVYLYDSFLPSYGAY
jgi:hypothetical protein